MIPKDPVMLLSFVNLKLRDFYSSLDALCEDLDADEKEITEKLASILSLIHISEPTRRS